MFFLLKLSTQYCYPFLCSLAPFKSITHPNTNSIQM
jgi:hypothetical protein